MAIERARILFCSRSFYLDTSSGAAVACRSAMACLARSGLDVEVLCGNIVDSGLERDVERIASDLSLPSDIVEGDRRHSLADEIEQVRTRSDHIPISVYRKRVSGFHLPDDREIYEFLALFEDKIRRFRPTILVTYGGDRLTRDLVARAKDEGIAVVFALHNFGYFSPHLFAKTDAILVPSEFAARYYRASLGLDCTVIPNLVDPRKVLLRGREHMYVTFVNPSKEKGLFPFARIADELGRVRPDIPFLVVESRGTEATLVSTGLDLRLHNNVSLMGHTQDPRDIWSVTRLCLMPSLWWENQPLVAIEAMINGIPVIGSDRGGIPEILGRSGVVLPLPERLTSVTEILPEPSEVKPWVDAIIHLWDNQSSYIIQSELALREVERLRPEIVERQYVQFFETLKPGVPPIGVGDELRSDWIVLVPSSANTSRGFEEASNPLSSAGIRVLREGVGVSLWLTRSLLLSQALKQECRSILLIDENIVFERYSVMRCMARPELVVTAGKLDNRVRGLYPIEDLSYGFLRLRSEVLSRMIESLDLVELHDQSGRKFWHFFAECDIVIDGGSRLHLDSAAAFNHRLKQIGVTPLADTSLQLSSRSQHDRSKKAAAWGVAATSWSQVPGFFDFAPLYSSAVQESPATGIFIEVGTLVGRSTCFLGEEIRKSGKSIILYAIDTCRGSPNDSTGREISPSLGGFYASELLRNIVGCCLDRTIVPILTESARAATLFPAETVDFCFIDGDHSYEGVMTDLKAWWPKVKPGGFMAGHDYRQSAPWLVDVTRAVHDFFGIADASDPLVHSCWSIRKNPTIN